MTHARLAFRINYATEVGVPDGEIERRLRVAAISKFKAFLEVHLGASRTGGLLLGAPPAEVALSVDLVLGPKRIPTLAGGRDL